MQPCSPVVTQLCKALFFVGHYSTAISTQDFCCSWIRRLMELLLRPQTGEYKWSTLPPSSFTRVSTVHSSLVFLLSYPLSCPDYFCLLILPSFLVSCGPSKNPSPNTHTSPLGYNYRHVREQSLTSEICSHITLWCWAQTLPTQKNASLIAFQ